MFAGFQAVVPGKFGGLTGQDLRVITALETQEFPNKHMKRAFIIPALSTALLLSLFASANAGSIGVSFLGDSWTGSVLRWQLAPTDSAGVIVQSNWNNLATT